MMDKSTQATDSFCKRTTKICIADLIDLDSPMLDIAETDNTSDLQKIQCGQHICNKCGKELANRHSLSRHKKGACKADGVRVGQKRSASAMDTTDIPKTSDDTEEITGTTMEEPQPKKRYRTKPLISTMEFDRLVQKPAVKWTSLTPATIYKLVWVYGGGNGNVIGNLEDGTGSIISTLLPRFVVDRLLRISIKPGMNTFIRPMGGEVVDIAVAEKLTCKNCKKEFTSPTFLNQHVLWCRKKVHRCSYCEKVFASPQSLSNHKKRCNRKVAEKSVDE